MTAITVHIELADARDGCTYARTYVDTPDFSESVADLISLTMPECRPDWITARIGNGAASGWIVDADGIRVGTFRL